MPQILSFFTHVLNRMANSLEFCFNICVCSTMEHPFSTLYNCRCSASPVGKVSYLPSELLQLGSAQMTEPFFLQKTDFFFLWLTLPFSTWFPWYFESERVRAEKKAQVLYHMLDFHNLQRHLHQYIFEGLWHSSLFWFLSDSVKLSKKLFLSSFFWKYINSHF